jgi:hypothetical protein
MLIVMMRWRSHPRRQAATVETGEVGPKCAGLQASQMPTAKLLNPPDYYVWSLPITMRGFSSAWSA